ncbi:MAG TPA: class II fumarate hydratase [Syntrophobacteraceae bacterium]|nr:class II fumarate hydratase [Syntrophobacteraceae bacterium]
MKTRPEKDALGTVLVPVDAYYGAQTQRAVENFPVSGLRFSRSFIEALGLVKKCAAMVNETLGLLDPALAPAIVRAAREVADGKLDDQFVLDVFQTGSGTSTNMNANEVIAGRANEILTGRRGGKSPVHPNDHVNLGQSSNDVIPSVLHIAALGAIRRNLLPALESLRDSLRQKSEEFRDVLKIGRTHLQDAVPVPLGREFGGYARQIDLAIERIKRTGESLAELALGGTAVGTGLNTHPEFAARVIEILSRETGIEFREAADHFEAQAAQDAAVEAGGALRGLAVALIKIANDLRWLASGPRCGLGEIALPALQPGSSIMPGKVNPVIPEVVIQVAAHVMGNDLAISYGGQGGYFELNTMLPLIAHNLLQSIELLSSVTDLFRTKCIRGIVARREECSRKIEQSLALATYLVPRLGYDQSCAVSQEAFRTGKTIREVVLEGRILSPEEVEELFRDIRAR